MNNIRDILLKEYEKYPHMELVDYVKLIFQHVNGGNHLLKDVNKAKQYLLEEYQEVEAKDDIPLYEDIGNNIVRINLSPFKYQGLDINLLFELFVSSANIFDKNIEGMEEAFETLRMLIKDCVLPFLEKELDEYLSWYRNEDYPLVSHSETYKQYYNPHYRIIHSLFLNDLFN